MSKSNPYDLDSLHRGGNITGPSGRLFKPTPNAADKAYDHDLAAAERRGEQRERERILTWLKERQEFWVREETVAMYESVIVPRIKLGMIQDAISYVQTQQAAQEQE